MNRPFLVQMTPSPLLSSGGDVDIVVNFAAPLPADAVPEIDGLVDAFWMLASTGGLSGEHISPAVSDIRDKSDIAICESLLHCRLINCHVDEHSLTCLLNLFEFIHYRYPIRQLDVFTFGLSNVQLQSVGDIGLFYPGQCHPRFPVIVNEPITETVTLTLQFATTLDVGQIEEVESTLLTWSVAPTIGGFAAPGAEVDRSSMIADLKVEVSENEVTWGIEKFRMDTAAVNSLVNCCAAMSDRIVSVILLEVS